MKSNKTMVLWRLVVLGGVLLLFLIGGILWWNDAISPEDPADTTPVVIRVLPGDSVREVASKLSSAQLIRSTIGFYLLVKTLGIERQMQAGEYRLTKSMDSKTIAQTLTHGTMDVWVTVLEGWRVEEIATKLARDLDIPEKEFLAVAREGYMFPDTYRLPKDASASGAEKMFEANFDKQITKTMKDDAAKSGLSIDDVVILASIVEREGNSDQDRPVIAGVLLNRLSKSWPLQTDATLQYALGYQTNGKTWWKKELTNEDKLVTSPYNTYENQGLPPGPIASPGLSSMKAVIYPKKTDYMFYLHDKSGGVHFARTTEEHEANIEKYLN